MRRTHQALFGLERCVQLAAFLLLPALSQPKRTYAARPPPPSDTA